MVGFKKSQQERRPDEKTPAAHHAAEPNPSKNAEMSPLFQKIIEVAQQNEYIPKGEFLFVPELRPYQEKIVDFICTHISKDMKGVGLDEEQMLGVFKFVFGRGWDSVYQRHMRPDGKIENVPTVGGNSIKAMHHGLFTASWRRGGRKIRTISEARGSIFGHLLQSRFRQHSEWPYQWLLRRSDMASKITKNYFEMFLI